MTKPSTSAIADTGFAVRRPITPTSPQASPARPNGSAR